MRRLSLAFALLLTLAAVLPASAQSPEPAIVTHTYLPILREQVTLSQAYPDRLEVALPFACLDSDEANPQQRPDGSTLFSCYRVDSGELNGGWTLYLLPDGTVAPGRQVTEGTLDVPDARAVIEPGRKVCQSRFDLLTADDGNVYSWCLPASNGRAKTLLIQRET